MVDTKYNYSCLPPPLPPSIILLSSGITFFFQNYHFLVLKFTYVIGGQHMILREDITKNKITIILMTDI